jgi:microcystin-dependent protein
MICAGQLLPISENDVLFQLIGTTYGGDGESTFALPNLQSRVPVHQGTGSGLSTYTMGETGGAESVTLITQQLPIHTHPAMTNNTAGTSATPANAIFGDGSATVTNTYVTPADFTVQQNQITLNSNTIGVDGGSQPHNNIQPTLAINYIISLFGVFPSPT